MANRKITRSAVAASVTKDERKANITDHGRGVDINVDALIVMATSGRSKAEVLFPAVHAAFVELGKPAGSKLPKLEDQPTTLPNMLDVQRWLDFVVDCNDAELKEDELKAHQAAVGLIGSLYQVLCDSVSDKFIKSITG